MNGRKKGDAKVERNEMRERIVVMRIVLSVSENVQSECVREVCVMRERMYRRKANPGRHG